MTPPWPNTNPLSAAAQKIQNSIPHPIFEYYTLRSQGLIRPLSEEEWEDRTAGASFFGCSFSSLGRQDAVALAGVEGLGVRVRFRDVDWVRNG